MDLTGKKILVTGGNGFLGKYVVAALKEHGVAAENIFAPSSAERDLRRWDQCEVAVKGMDIVIHLAAVVGGIGANKAHPGVFFYDNAIMGIQLMEAARQAGVAKFLSVGTVCAYPKFAPIPFKEEDLWNGYPEETNSYYALAKKMLIVQGDGYKKEYGFNAVHLIPVNLYGPGDNFDPKTSHVIPALIRRMEEAKKNNAPEVVAWGTGKATREFIFAADAAEGIVLAAEKYDKTEPVNLGAGKEISIKDLTEYIAKVVGFTGKITWDTTKPDGQPRRMMDVSKAETEFGFRAKTSFEDGLRQTVEWYLQNQ